MTTPAGRSNLLVTVRCTAGHRVALVSYTTDLGFFVESFGEASVTDRSAFGFTHIGDVKQTKAREGVRLRAPHLGEPLHEFGPEVRAGCRCGTQHRLDSTTLLREARRAQMSRRRRTVIV